MNDQEWKAVAWLFWLFVFVALGLVVFAAYMGLGR